MEFPKAFFVTGTDTGIGKTLVSAMLMSGLNSTYWKPIQSGTEEETDSEFVKRISECEDSRILPERFLLTTPASPHYSAEIDKVEMKLSDFELPAFETDHLIVEGAGGLIVPINWKETVFDIIKKLNLPVLLVGRSGLGTLNHTLLTLEKLKNEGIEVFGVVLSGEPYLNNTETIRRFGNTKVFELPIITDINKENLNRLFKVIFSAKS